MVISDWLLVMGETGNRRGRGEQREKNFKIGLKEGAVHRGGRENAGKWAFVLLL